MRIMSILCLLYLFNYMFIILIAYLLHVSAVLIRAPSNRVKGMAIKKIDHPKEGFKILKSLKYWNVK